MSNEEIKERLKKEWDNEKNNGLNINDFSFGSHKKVWWKCNKGHEWEAEIKRRYSGSGCPYCANKKLLTGYNDLATTNPDLAKEWNYEKNGKLRPEDVIAGNHSKVWWKCKNNHEWQMTILSRKRGENCPFCSNKKIIIGYNDLATTHPNLLKEWNYQRNKINPENVTSGADKKVWWICEKGHEWEALIKNRKLGQICPYCSNNKVLTGYNDLATTHPILAKEWHPTKNGMLKPTDILAGSNKYIWWKCEQGHEWKTKSLYRSMGENCPFCQNRSVLTGYNDLATTNPELLKEWNYEKNGIKPEKIVAGSSIKVWWRCKKGHEWKTDVNSRTLGHNCPKCAEELKTSLPERTIFYYIKKYFKDSVNNYYPDFLERKELDIYIPSLNTGIEYDGERFHNVEKDKYKDELCFKNNITLYRVREKNCERYNSKSIKIYLKENNNISLYKAIGELLTALNVKKYDIDIEKDIDDIYALIDYLEKENSILKRNPELAKEWNYEKNGKLRPEEFSVGSHYKVWWKCNNGHEWRAEIKSRNIGRKCPYCSNNKLLPSFNDLATTNPELLKEWDYEKNKIKPNEVMSGSEKKAWWRCSKCGNEWETMIKTRKRGSGCPRCNGGSK